MNIVLLLNNDIASNLALNLLLPSIKTHQLSVFLSSKVGGNSAKPEKLQQLAQFEQQQVFQRLAQIKPAIGFKNYADIAKEMAIDIGELNQINSEQGYQTINACQPDLIISIRYGGILKSPIIKLAKYGVINLHSGDLPDYRGVMATFWALKNRENTLSATLHSIDDGTIDTGGIIAKSTIEVKPTQSYLWHVLMLYVGGCKLITQSVNFLIAHKRLPEKQPQSQQAGNYYSFPNQTEINDFIAQHGALYNEDEIVTLMQTLMLR